MNKITIYNNTYDAIVWASKQFGNQFQVQNLFPSKAYSFEFADPKHAVEFALKWT